MVLNVGEHIGFIFWVGSRENVAQGECFKVHVVGELRL